jgi:ABC-type nitrate/sulfonate/bicarbonate transport system permease component
MTAVPAMRYVPLLILALAWEAAPKLGLISPLMLPTLSSVLSALAKLAWSGDLFVHGASSLYRTAIGLSAAIVVGSVAGVFMAWSSLVQAMVQPIIRLFYPMPKSALIPVLALWLGFGDSSKIVLIFLGCLLPVTVAAYNGARNSEQVLVWSARSMGASRLRMLWDVMVPSALPELLSGIRIALAYSFILLVSSELVAAQKGLGYMISLLGEGGVYDGMFAVVLTIGLFGFVADRLFQMLSGRLLQWRE